MPWRSRGFCGSRWSEGEINTVLVWEWLVMLIFALELSVRATCYKCAHGSLCPTFFQDWCVALLLLK